MKNDEENDQGWKAELGVKIAFFLQWVAFLLSFIAFFSPFWYVELNTGITAGLWGRCDDDECIWFLERDYAWERSLPDWHVAAQVLFAIGIGILFISCCLAIGTNIFQCCPLKPGYWAMIYGILIAIALVFETFSIGTFGIGAYHVYECSINSWVAHFEWAFYVGICALFMCLFASLTYIFAGYSLYDDVKDYTAYGYSI